MEIRGLLLPDVEKLFNETLYLNQIPESSLNKLTDEEMSLLIKEFDTKVIDKYIQKAKLDYVDFIDSSIQIHNNIAVIHKKPFEYFLAYVKLSNDLFHNLRKNVDEKSISDNLIISYYGYSIRLANQVLTMLLNGYQDGALRIWRSLYEHTVVLLLFIKESDNFQLFENFQDYLNRNRIKTIKSYQDNHQELSFPPIENDILNNMQESKDKLSDQFGSTFMGNDYGWASILFQKERITFRDVEEKVNLQKLRPYYIWASAYIHPTFNSITDFQENENEIKISKITKQSLEHSQIIDPLQLTLLALHNVNIEILNLYCIHHEIQINIQLFKKIFEEMKKTF